MTTNANDTNFEVVNNEVAVRGYIMNLSPRWATFIAMAAEATGYKIEYREHPMPNNPVEGMGSVYSYEPADRDNTYFWDVFREMRDKQVNL
jgi:hypothetical protein